MPENWSTHRRALAEAQAWCALKLDMAEPATSLRSAALRPAGYPDAWEYGNMVPDEVGRIIQRRRELMPPQASTAAAIPPPGRILCVLGQTDTQTTEGVPASDGVIDESYLPPWDGWFAVVALRSGHCLLLAWIPGPLTGLVQQAAELSATQTIVWLDEDLPPNWAWEYLYWNWPYWHWRDTNWGRLPADDLSTLETARRELCRASSRLPPA